MKITYEFNTLSEDFIPLELYKIQKADDMAACLDAITSRITYWWENADTIDTNILHKEIFNIVESHEIHLDRLIN